MSDELPEGWARANLFDLCDPKQWPTVSMKDLTATGYPVFGANGTIGFYPEYNHERETVLITCRGATCGTLNICEPRSYVTGNSMALDGVRETALDFRFLLYALKNRGLDDTISGSAQPQITRANLRVVNLPLPPPAEQRRIVEKVEALLPRVNAARDRLAKVPAILKRFRQSVLAAACSGRLTEEWRGSPYYSIQSDSDADDLPKGWTWARIGEVFRVETGTTPPKKHPANYASAPTGCPFFKPTDIDAGYNVRDAREWLSMNGQEQARLLPALTVCVTSIGATIGKTGLLRVCGATNQQINAILPADCIAPEFIYFYCCSPRFQQRVVEESSSTTLPIINKGRFKALEFPKPPLQEQQEIVRRVEALFSRADAIERHVAAATARANKVTQAILAKAFRGELVPTEAELARQEGRDYESASVLLARIAKTATSGENDKASRRRNRGRTRVVAEKAD